MDYWRNCEGILGRGNLLAGLVLLLLAASFSSCATRPPTRYYTLDMRPSGQATPAYAFSVERFRVAQALSRNEIMIKMSPTEVEYYATDQWVAHIGELVARKLQVELESEAADGPTLEITGTIHAFEQVDLPEGAEVHVELAVELRPPLASRHAEPLFQRHYRDTRPAGAGDPVTTVEALSRALESIARAIAEDTHTLAYPG